MNARSTVAGSGDLNRIAELTPEASANVRHQHVISQVLLREFATPSKRVSGRHVQPYDLRHPERRLKTRAPRGVAQIENFVPFASASLEDTWGEVERELPDAFAAVKAGDAFNDPHIGTVLRDLIALHYVRSQHYRELFHRLFAETYQEQRRWLLTNGALRLQAAALERTGLYTTGPQGLAARADELLDVMMTTYRNGSLLRVRIEDNFGKARQLISRSPLEILEPEEGEFLIGDNPALTVRHHDDKLLYSMALGDAHSTVLPIGPRHMLALGPADRYAAAAKADVDRMNVLQIKASRRYVYTRPGSPLAPMIREVSHHWLADHNEIASE
ncbi:DUF4238 domain-containing protein [Streptomyces populi]|uniref:DUF4238 domain-containing protein n=1 Tax=Streptomyces populi TaxID=2058924 RepID=UPI0013A6EF65|nr:DUF4238 domain-containing protein [Streptomyces populi]